MDRGGSTTMSSSKDIKATGENWCIGNLILALSDSEGKIAYRTAAGVNLV
jgi:hypothetical protein